jgi:hypothetical protein
LDFAFTPEQLSFRDIVRALLRRECTPARVRDAWSREDGRVPGLWEALAELGVPGMLAPEVDGGLGMTDLDLVLLLEEHGRFAAPEPVTDTAAVAVPLLREVGGAASERWLRPVAAGAIGVALGLAGAPFVAGADAARLLLLESDGEVHALEHTEVTLEPQPSVDGARRLSRVTWTPSASTRIAAGPVSLRALADARDRAAVGTAAELIGLARQMLDVTVAHAKTRHQFGKPIGSFQAVKHHLADALIAVEMAAPSVYRAAYSLAHAARDRSVHASMAKALASDAAWLTARKALQCHGAIGYAFEGDLHLWMKRTWALATAWGDAASHRARVAATLFAAGGV